MRQVTWLTLAGVFLAGVILGADSPGQGRGKKHDNDDYGNGDTAAHVDVHVVFGSRDVAMLREYYAPRYRNLPPGLQKKVARGGQLPPGWQKKLEAFPDAIEQRLTPLPSPYRRGVIDGHAVIYNPRSNVVVDLAVLF